MSGQNTKTGTRLDVPYSEKNAAKQLGAKWNSTKKFWYAPAGSDLSKFKRWLPSKPAPTSPPSRPTNPNQPTQPAQPIQPARPIHPPQLTRPSSPVITPTKSTGSNFIWPIVIIIAYLIFQLNYKHVSKPAAPPSNGQLKLEYYQSHGYSSCHSNEAVRAICGDGWESDSAGPGTCSHHNGVREYICPAKSGK